MYVAEIAGALDLFAGFAADLVESTMKAEGVPDEEFSPQKRLEHEKTAYNVLVMTNRIELIDVSRLTVPHLQRPRTLAFFRRANGDTGFVPHRRVSGSCDGGRRRGFLCR